MDDFAGKTTLNVGWKLAESLYMGWAQGFGLGEEFCQRLTREQT